ncbi:MAG: hypothetical protein QOD00_2921 [Blastocatellia bacterium]|jgi:hypothetical protein|nr:hypothetical protein [Blastocatellia bacterium]
MPHARQLIEKELEDLLEVESRTRDFVEFIERVTRTSPSGKATFANQTLDFVSRVKPHLEKPDEVRRKKTD